MNKMKILSLQKLIGMKILVGMSQMKEKL